VSVLSWRRFLAGGLVAAVAYFLLPGSERVAAVGSAGFAWSAAVAVVVGVRRYRPTDRGSWWLIAAALLALGAGDVLLLASPAADLADLCFLITYVGLTVALLRLVRARRRGRDVPALLDALVISIGLGVVSWQFLMVPYAHDPSLSLDQKLTSIVLPLADILLLAVLVRLWSGGGHRPAAYWLLGLAVAALLAADTAFGVVSLRGRFLPGGPIDAGYMVFALAYGAAALHPSMAAIAAPGAPSQPRVTRWRLLLLGGAAVLAPAVQLLEWARGRAIEVPVMAAGSIAIFLLIVARTQRLTREVTVQDERRRLLGRVLHAAEDERTRIAHDLHDGPVQQLAVLSYEVHRARKRLTAIAETATDRLVGDLHATDALLRQVERGLAEQLLALRGAMSALRPPVLDDRGFGEALRDYAQRFQHDSKIAVDLAVGLRQRLAPDLETVLYRIMQESLANVAKHARAQRVWVTVDQTEQGAARLRVHDDGVGFDAATTAQLLREGHFGLAGMRERASLVGGTLNVRSSPAGGTTVEVTLPLRR
jgi:signal transduction histidine kinase